MNHIAINVIQFIIKLLISSKSPILSNCRESVDNLHKVDFTKLEYDHEMSKDNSTHWFNFGVFKHLK